MPDRTVLKGMGTSQVRANGHLYRIGLCNEYVHFLIHKLAFAQCWSSFYNAKFSFFVQALVIQVKCFEEIISIGYQVYRIHGLPWFRSLSWYFLLTSNYFFYGENLVDYFGVVINRLVGFTNILICMICIISTRAKHSTTGTKCSMKYSYLNTGILAVFGHLPSVLVVHTLLHWIRVVCAVAGEKVLHETVQSVRVDARGAADCCDAELSDHPKHFRRPDLVHCAGVHDRVQRCDGVHVRFLFRTYAADQVEPEKNVGGFRWWRHQHGDLRSGFLVSTVPVSVLRVPDWVQRICRPHDDGMRTELHFPAAGVFTFDGESMPSVSAIAPVIIRTIFSRSNPTKRSPCIRSSYIRCRWVSSVRSSVHLVDFLRPDSSAHSKSKYDWLIVRLQWSLFPVAFC